MQRLEEIKARLAERTLGEWKWDGPRCYKIVIVGEEDWNTVLRASRDCEIAITDEDAALIANAPADMEWLIHKLDIADKKIAMLNHHLRQLEGEPTND